MDWPRWDEKYLADDTMHIAVQVNGKLRGDLTIDKTATKEQVEAAARSIENVVRFVGEQEPAKIIYVPGKIVNIVVKK